MSSAPISGFDTKIAVATNIYSTQTSGNVSMISLIWTDLSYYFFTMKKLIVFFALVESYQLRKLVENGKFGNNLRISLLRVFELFKIFKTKNSYSFKTSKVFKLIQDPFSKRSKRWCTITSNRPVYEPVRDCTSRFFNKPCAVTNQLKMGQSWYWNYARIFETQGLFNIFNKDMLYIKL